MKVKRERKSVKKDNGSNDNENQNDTIDLSGVVGANEPFAGFKKAPGWYRGWQ